MVDKTEFFRGWEILITVQSIFSICKILRLVLFLKQMFKLEQELQSSVRLALAWAYYWWSQGSKEHLKGYKRLQRSHLTGRLKIRSHTITNLSEADLDMPSSGKRIIDLQLIDWLKHTFRKNRTFWHIQ